LNSKRDGKRNVLCAIGLAIPVAVFTQEPPGFAEETFCWNMP